MLMLRPIPDLQSAGEFIVPERDRLRCQVRSSARIAASRILLVGTSRKDLQPVRDGAMRVTEGARSLGIAG